MSNREFIKFLRTGQSIKVDGGPSVYVVDHIVSDEGLTKVYYSCNGNAWSFVRASLTEVTVLD